MIYVVVWEINLNSYSYRKRKFRPVVPRVRLCYDMQFLPLKNMSTRRLEPQDFFMWFRLLGTFCSSP